MIGHTAVVVCKSSILIPLIIKVVVVVMVEIVWGMGGC